MARRDPGTKRLVSSIALILPSTDEVFLFDATPDLHEQLVALRDIGVPPTGRVDRSPVAGVFLTHAHIGHYLGLAFFGYEVINTSGLRVMASPRMSEFLRRNGPWSQLVEMKNIVLDEIEPGQTRRIADSVTVEAFSAPHRDEYADTLGFILRGPSRSLLYLPDTDSWTTWDYSVEGFVAQVDVALLDGTFYSADELPGRSVDRIGHPLISTSMDLFQELVDSSQTQVFFTHLNHSNKAIDSHSEAAGEIRDRGYGVLAEGDRFDL
jgi:pyrroloquinoline quinone biosynthesis protein B